MNSIYRLLDFLIKEDEDLPFKDFSSSSSTATATPPATTKPMEVGTGGQAASAVSVQEPTAGKADGEDSAAPHGHDRLYLSEIGGKSPEGYKGKVFSGRQGAQFIDRRLLTPAQKGELHPKDDTKETSYGGIIINAQGQILLRKPKDHYGGHHWTFAKGGSDGNESPHEAALREVKEETGFECEVVGDVPGHFQGTLGNNKFFLMQVTGGDKSLFQTNETSDVQWFDPADAEAQISKTGETNEKGMKRDLDVLKAALHEHGDQKNSKEKMSQMIQNVQKNPTPDNFKIMEGVEDVAKHFAATGELPSYYTDSDHLQYDSYQPFREAVLDRLINPSNTSGSINQWIGSIYDNKAFRDKYGVFSPKSLDKAGAKGLSAIAALRKTLLYEHIEANTPSWATPLAISEYLGEILNAPQVYATKGTGHTSYVLPPDIDIHGNKMYRSIEEREVLSEAWEKWKSGGDAVGKLPPKYNPATGKMEGGGTFDFSVGGWELAGERASATYKARQDSGVDANIKATLTKYGKDIPKLPGEKTQAQAGERLMRDFVQFHRKLNIQMLDMAYPKVSHMVLYRGIGGASEVAPGTGVGKGKSLSPDDLHKFGMPKLGEETVDNTYESYVNSRPGAGWGLHPLSFGRDYTLAAEVPKSNIFLSSLDMQNISGEREWMVLNNPNMRAKVMHHAKHSSSLLKNSQDWDYMPYLNGVAIKGMFHEKKGIGVTATDSQGKPHTWNVGVDEPDKDWSTLGTLGKQQGSRPGGMFTDPDGQKWYIKHGHEDQHVVEDLANKLYRHAGIKVPETKLINWGGKVAHASRILDDVDETKSYTGESLKNKSDIHDGFLVDALLGNWDVAGTGYSNILPTTNGEHYRIDNGGSLYLRAKGDEKVFGSTDDMKTPVSELGTLTNSEMNKETSTVFSGMTQAAMQSSFEKLTHLNNTSIANMVHASGIPPYKMDDMTKALVSRRNNIVQWLVDNNHLTGLPEVGDAASQYRAIENKYNLQKADTIMEDNPTVDVALALLKKRPLLHLGFEDEEVNDTERN
jgi:8-oxo-dGTP pyrophosphatase MutT (NUDIX family)